MLSRRVLINLAAFFAISFGLVLYGAVTLLGNPLAERRSAYAVFPDASGILAGFSASMNGVVIGHVTGVRLDEEGARVEVSLDPGQELPGDVQASIVRASAVGEQRIEFTPQHGGDAPPLPDGAEVPVDADAAPPEISRVIETVDDLLAAIPPEDLNTVVHEGATALRGREEDLRALTRNLDVANREFLQHEAGFRQLLATSPELLDALTEVAPEIESGLANTAELTQLLADRRFDLTQLQRDGADFADEANGLLESQSADLACLAHDFGILSERIGSPGPLSDLDQSLTTNQNFFGPVNSLAVHGHAEGFPEYGSVDREDQGWLRVQTLIPPEQPSASRYTGIRGTPDIRPGNGCANALGEGVGPASQLDPPEPTRRGGYAATSTERIELGPIDGSTAASTSDTDAANAGTGDTPRADDTEASRGGATRPGLPTLAAAAPIRADRAPGGGGVDWFTVGAVALLLLAAAGVVKVVGAVRQARR